MSTREEWAERMWQVLIAAAAERRTVTYHGLVEAVGYRGADNTIGPPLNLIWQHCKANGLPQLGVLVVRKDTGRPSEAARLEQLVDVDSERERVFAHRWYGMVPPRF